MSNTLSNVRTLFGRKTAIGAVLVAGAIGGSVALSLPASAATTTANWTAIAQAESGGNWHINTGNGFGGGLQISPQTSASLGGPSTAAGIAALSPSAQIALAEKILAVQGPGAWPNTFVSGGSSTSSSTATSATSASSAPTHTSSAPTQTPTHVTHSAVKTHAFTGGTVSHNRASGGHFFSASQAGTYRADVAAWQTRMAGSGYHLSVDGHYGKQSADVAVKFQKAHNLLVDGVVGPQTWGATFG